MVRRREDCSLSNLPARLQVTPATPAVFEAADGMAFPEVARMPKKHPVIQLRRSGVHKCYCQAAPLTSLHALLPPAMNVVQLARLHKFHEFLKIDRPSIKRTVVELIPDTMEDATEYERFREYLIRGRQNQSRAGVALEMESQGYKVFILPPGQEAKTLGYGGDMMLAVIRSSW